MRVTSVDMYSATLEEAISFSLFGNEPRAQYEVRTILGLDAEEIVPKFYASNIDGDKKFYNFGMKPRDIVLRVILKPRFDLEEDYASVRDRLYRTISANRTGLVTLHFNAGSTVVAGISGSIVKFEAVHFTNLPEVQITIRCNDPMFKGISPVVFEPTELSAANPVFIPDSISTSPHGFEMEVTFTGNVASFTIQDAESDPEWDFVVTPSGGFLTGDVLHISSEYSNKQIYMVRSAVTTYLADKLSAGSVWPILFPGSNSFHFTNIASFDWEFVRYYASYWGV
jgi:hypothetical protein